MLCLPYPGMMVNSGGGTKDGAWDVCGKDLGGYNSLSQTQQQHNTMQPQHSRRVGHENDFAHPTPPPTTETQQQHS